MALTEFKSQLIADVGISTGDEGKGRVVYEIAAELKERSALPDPLAMVLKVNGGANSGHTAGGLKHNLLPCGILDPSIHHLALGSGVVADPRKLLWELRPLEARGIPALSRLAIDERTMVSDITHRLLDLAWEHYRVRMLGEEPRGSTGRGISPAYQDETGQWQMHYSEFLGDKTRFARRLNQRVDRALRTIEYVCRVDATTWFQFFDQLTQAELRANAEAVQAGVFPPQEFDFGIFRTAEPFQLNVGRLIDVYWRAGTALASCIRDVRELVLGALDSGRYVLGEFGQAYWLDKRHGFPPNVTASHTFVPELFQSAGIPLHPVHTVCVAKAYDTKVGTHTFLTEIDPGHPLGRLLRLLEFGTSTGRQRLVGWFDAVEKGDALRHGGGDDLVINKLDALTHRGDWNGALLVCTAYRLPSGEVVAHVPRDEGVHRAAQPVCVAYPGWGEDISRVRRFADLPPNCRAYVAGILRAVTEIARRTSNPPNLRYLGVGPDPSQIIRDIPPATELLAQTAAVR